MGRKKLYFALALVPLIGGWFWWSATRANQANVKGDPKIVTVDRGLVRQIVPAAGRISANFEVDIKCKASGEVIKLPFDVSDVVQKGELVLELDPIDEQRAVMSQEAALTAAQCGLEKAKQTLKISEETLVTDTRQAEIALNSAIISAHDLRSKAQRVHQLLISKLVSAEEDDSAEANALTAESNVEAAKNALEALKTRPVSIEMNRTDVKLAETQVSTMETNLDDAKERLKETKVMAPITGVVTTRPAQIGTIVSSGITNVGGGSSIMTLCDLSRLFVLAPVDESDIGRVKLDQAVVIQCDAFPDKKFQGKIIRIAAKGLNMQSVVTFEVKIEVLGEGKELLRPEMTTDIEIEVAKKESVLRLPSEAVLTRDKDKKRYVRIPAASAATQKAPTTTTVATTVAAPVAKTVATSVPATAPATNVATSAPANVVGKIPTVERDVEVGVDDGAFCEIVSGLAEGDQVVLDPERQGNWDKLKANNDEGF